MACFHDAELEHAVALLAGAFRQNVILLGAHAVRIDGEIAASTLEAAFVALSERAGRQHALLDPADEDGFHWLGPTELLRRPRANVSSLAGCKGVAFSLQRAGAEQVLRLVADVNHLKVEVPVRLGPMTIVGRDIDGCRVVAKIAAMGGGSASTADGKLVLARFPLLPPLLPTEAKPWAPGCSPDISRVCTLPCFPIADLEVVGVIGEGEERRAVIRNRYGRTSFAPGFVVRVGDFVGREELRIVSIDEHGMADDLGHHIDNAPSASN
jgi:hypothetical protein